MKRRVWVGASGLAVMLSLGVGQIAWGDRAPDAFDKETAATKLSLEASDARWHHDLDEIAKDPQKRAAIVAKKSNDLAQQARAAVPEDPPQAIQPGIVEGADAPASGSDFLGRNGWIGIVSQRGVRVFAGQAGGGSSTGRLIVMIETPSRTVAAMSTHDISGSCALRIVSVEGHVLQLVDETGTTRAFDVASLIFLPNAG